MSFANGWREQNTIFGGKNGKIDDKKFFFTKYRKVIEFGSWLINVWDINLV